MKPSEKFKQAIREGRIQEAFAIAMGNAPQLSITTWIADAQTNGTHQESQPKSSDCLRTRVNLIEGEIVNEIGEATIQDKLYGTLQKFHLDRVASSHQTVSENLQSLQQMFRLLTVLQKQQQGENIGSLETWQIDNPALTSQPTAAETEIMPDSFNSAFLPPDSFEIEQDDLEDDSMLDDLLTLDELELDPEPIEHQPIGFETVEPETIESDTVEPETAESETSEPEILVDRGTPEEDWGDLLDEDPGYEDKPSLQMLDLKTIELTENMTDDAR